MVSWEDPGRYLGLPTRWGRSKNRALEWIKEKILDKMQGWKEKLLNQAEKEILIKAVIQAIPAFAMNVIKFPKSFCKGIEAAIARFCLWEAREGRNTSWIWKSLLEGRDFLRRKGRWSIGSGTEIDIWEDNWVARIGKIRRCGEEQTIKVSDLIKQGEGWDENRIKELFPGNIAELITRTPISLINKKDNLIWPYRAEGQYSVKSCYRAAKEEKDTKEEIKFNEVSSSQNLKEIWGIIWRLPVPQKIRMFLWKAVEGILPTRNQYIFQQAKINPEQAIINAEYLAVEYHNTTRESSTDHNSSNGIIGDRKRITWRTPPQDRLKVNTDAAFHRDTGKAASAVVVRNWQGKIITGTTTKFITTSALAAEAQAYREALILIKNLQIENCIIETDCLPLVQAVKARTPIAEVDAILRDILQLLEEAPAVRAT
ncbi:uncharacterized protein [Arachis hypogaea]|uniref:uncharacterized protein n=1 Tax=Arachis hypogaea TaxID=3818 RepID=UPI000DECD36C|nr:uncharacterized protein LOC112783305 [Arachis hypogaea]